MSTGGAIALIITWLGTLIGSWVAISNLRHSVAKEHANRRLALEDYADAVGRWIRNLRKHLLETVQQGMDCPHCRAHIDNVVDADRINMSNLIPPVPPKYNGS